MSLRRPATAAGSRKYIPLPVPTSSHRPKSALAKSATSSATSPSEDNFCQDKLMPSFPSRPRFKQPTTTFNEDESNIQVVIRCRRRSDREIQDGSPVILTTNGPRGENVTIETAPPSSILGVVTLPPTRTYPFDRVFGPEADQAMVYNDVVAPILEQVLMGYNCTLFAYGQTGTGKTYTMQGDLTPSHLGNPSAGAGMIPRVLFRLFQHLEAHVPDYSVKISFVELYNEELRDLLAPEMTAPLGNAQPMSVGGGQQGQNHGTQALKLFDDASKRGVFIQGLEEAVVKDAADAIVLLTKGSQRRQIAATKFNDHSSRSHSVFSITVHSKEPSALGDDLLKVGKLNLVDLAGSENIGRSGAENKRAREAGMINQSLLTLGRVINALVEKSAHVPYRESKLTRLLQDSLGGRTKTCIIATVSPARFNLEETLSTLEYALRAKSIRNKPEVNQRLTKNMLIKEYVSEIERLKADVLAAREMNGIYFSQDSWDQISAEHELRQTQYEEAKRQAVIAESQLSALREEFEQSIALLLRRDSELKATKETLEVATSKLHAKADELDAVKCILEEEVVVKDAHRRTEAALDGVATMLKAVVEKSVEDIHGLFDKLGRKSSVAGANVQAVSEYGRSLNSDIISMSTRLEEFTKTHSQLTSKLRVSAQQFHTVETEVNLAVHLSLIDEQLRKLDGFVGLLRSGESASNDAIDAVQAVVKDASKAIKGAFGTWSSGVKNNCESLCDRIQASGIGSASAVEKVLRTMAAMLEHVVREAREHMEQERNVAMELGALVRDNANVEIQRLRQQNTLLAQLLDDEKAKSEHARDELIQRVSGLLGEYTEARDRSLRDAISDVHQHISTGEAAASEFVAAHGSWLEIGVKRRREWETSLEKRGAGNKKARDAGIKAVGNITDGFKDGLTAVQTSVANSVALQMNEVDKQGINMTVACSAAFDTLDRVKKARTDATESFSGNAQDGYRSLQQGLGSTSSQIVQTANMLMNETSSFETSMQLYRSTAAKQISNVKQTTQSLLEKGTREDIPIGTTPRKRHWEYPDHWQLTKPREELTRDWRERRCDPVVHNQLAKDIDIKVERDEPDGLIDTLEYSSSSALPCVHRSTEANEFGKVTKIPPLNQPTALREHPINLLPHSGSRRL